MWWLALIRFAFCTQKKVEPSYLTSHTAADYMTVPLRYRHAQRKNTTTSTNLSWREHHVPKHPKPVWQSVSLHANDVQRFKFHGNITSDWEWQEHPSRAEMLKLWSWDTFLWCRSQITNTKYKEVIIGVNMPSYQSNLINKYYKLVCHLSKLH